MQYYKLVYRCTNGATGETYLQSLVNHRFGFNVVYPINEWAYPKYPSCKLFVFNGDNVLNEKMGGNLELYTCEVKNPIEIPEHIKLIPIYTNHIQDFWHNIDKFQNNRMVFPLHNYMTIPKDTVWCDAVKLLERIPMNYTNYSKV